MLLETLAASILGNALSGGGLIRQGEGRIKAGHPLNNFEIQKYY